MKTSKIELGISEFMKEIEKMKNNLERLTSMVDDHMELRPGEINWGHVGDLKHYNYLLSQITDSVFKEGEYSN